MGPTFAFKDGVKEREITKVFVHCSDSSKGDAQTIEKWHIDQGLEKIGYHWVIRQDGIVEAGRPEWEIGAHAKGYNKHSIGVCLIGKDGLFTVPQLRAATKLIKDICREYFLSYHDIMGHYEVNKNKTCPGFKITEFRALIRRE